MEDIQMSNSSFPLRARLARRFADPNFTDSPKIDRHVFFVRITDVPVGIPLDPNARVPNINRRVYRDVRKSLLNEESVPGTFHLKHKGITLIASRVEHKGKDQYVLHLEKGHGILDGGHSYEIITSTSDEDVPEHQFVKLEVLTGIPDEWIVDIAGGLNTSVQVQSMSLDNLSGLFEWIKEEVADQPYSDVIAWRENEAGDFDARDIVALMTCFNIEAFPNESDRQPVAAYERKATALKLFEENPEAYKKLRPILKEILILHDTIRYESREYWNEQGGSFGNFAFVESRRKGEFYFPFIGKKLKSRLMNGALYPMLASFRWMVETNMKTGDLQWRGDFSNVLSRWDLSAPELLRMTAQANNELGRNPNAIGKSRNHWANLHARVAMRDLMAKTASKSK
ncbi:AIPR family protein [Bacteroidota bacterium]